MLEQCGPCPISGPDSHPYRGHELHATDSETARRLWDGTIALIETLGIVPLAVKATAAS